MTSASSSRPLAQARVLVVGMGGLGCPVTLALAQAGVGLLSLVDPDRVELSNLHRQPWHRDADIGRLKVDSAAEKLRAAFPRLQVETQAVRMGPENVLSLLAGHDVVVDGTDGVETKFLLNDAAVRAGVPLVHGGVVRHEGLVLVVSPGGPCLRCLFEEMPGEDALPTCARAGVLGAAAGWVGGLQAAAAERLLRGEPLTGAMWRVDARSGRARRVSLRARPDCPCCGVAGVEVGSSP
jgi:adenylyltransferase/sulfurtransferase